MAKDIIAGDISDNAEYRTWIRERTFQEGRLISTAKDPAEKSVYEYLENVVGDTIVTTRRTLTVEKITEIDEKYLELVDCGAMAVVTSETYNAAGEMFEYV